MKSLSCCALIVAIAGSAFSASAGARVVVGVDVGFPPPAPRVETVVTARPGQVWIPGYWRWTGATHIWVGGYWTRARPGYRYVPAAWVHAGPAWRFHAGYWRRW